MVNRRNFFKSSSLLAGGMGLMRPVSAFAAASKPSGYFGVHPFVEQHPEAVFIMRTHVDYKTNSAACRQVGLDFGRSALVPMDKTGAPVSSIIAAKPNLTAHNAVDEKNGFTLEDTMGICTDAFFTEGVFTSLMELGVPGKNMNTRDINGNRIIEPRGYVAMGQRTGAVVTSQKNRIATADDARDESAFVWREVPKGVVYEQIPYMWPFNAPNAWNINLAKFKAHEMGLTLTAKNLQGTNASPFQGYCQKWTAIDSMQKLEKTIHKPVINPNVRDIVDVDYKRHQRTIPRFDIPTITKDNPGYHRLLEEYDPLCMELWAHRTIDNLAASNFGLHVIEGIYGRDGDFNWGPNPHGNDDVRRPLGRAWDYMTNIVIFGKNPYLVDIVGHWLGGHEPGNFSLFHIAMERGKIGVMNPMNIPVYEWLDGIAVRRPLTGFTRTPLRTFYLLKHQTKELFWHLCDEPFDYKQVTEKKHATPAKPASRLLNQHYPNANNPQLAIEFSLPETGWAMVEILDQSGKSLETVF
ncbi:MAG: hypothetical protein ACYC9O_21230, partial [Candidatus Latescibacterota bacterium]